MTLFEVRPESRDSAVAENRQKYEHWNREAFVKAYLEAYEHKLSTKELADNLRVNYATIRNRVVSLKHLGIKLPRLYSPYESTEVVDVGGLNRLIEVSVSKREGKTDETD